MDRDLDDSLRADTGERFEDEAIREFGSATKIEATKKIGLSMIVKDEAQIVLRCLESARPLIDYAMIEDTGSRDGTQVIIKN